MKTLQDLIKDLTDIIVDQEKINDYLASEALDLRGADLNSANLTYADLRWAKLQDAILIGADLRGAKLKDAD
ncbi:hypothetical protein C6B38_06940, partial [Spiroplasma sp. ChiS]